MIRKKHLNTLTIVIAWLLSFRDYIYVFKESLSPIVSIFIYGLLFSYFFLDIFLFSKWKLPKHLALGLLFIVIVTLFHFSSYPILTIFLFVYLLKDMSLEKIVSIFFYPRLIMTLVVMCLYHLGFTNDVATTISYKLGGGTFHTMGISRNPNTTALYFLSTIMLTYLYGNISKKRYFYFLPLFVCIYIVKMTLSRTVLISTVALYLFDIIFRTRKNSFIIKSALFLPFFYVIMTLLLATIFSDNSILNKLFSFRPKYWNDYLSQLVVREMFFGSVDSKGITIDSGFLQLFINGGICLFVPFLFLLKKSLRGFCHVSSCFYVFMLTCFTYSVMESAVMTQLRDITTLLFLVMYNSMLQNSRNCRIKIEYI